MSGVSNVRITMYSQAGKPTKPMLFASVVVLTTLSLVEWQSKPNQETNQLNETTKKKVRTITSGKTNRKNRTDVRTIGKKTIVLEKREKKNPKIVKADKGRSRVVRKSWPNTEDAIRTSWTSHEAHNRSWSRISCCELELEIWRH